MKKTLIALLALSSFAMGETISLTLPGADPVANKTGYYGSTATDVLNNKGAWDYGVHAGNNGGPSNSMTGTKEGEEGYWSGDSITLAGRNGTQGESAILILGNGAFEVGSLISSITLTATIKADSDINNRELEFGIGLRDTSANDYAKTAVKTLTGSGTEDVAVELTLTMDTPFVWAADDKIVIATNGPAFNPADATYIVDDYAVSVTYSAPAPTPAVPEPTTATLSLLALAGLAARRRRK